MTDLLPIELAHEDPKEERGKQKKKNELEVFSQINALPGREIKRKRYRINVGNASTSVNAIGTGGMSYPLLSELY